MSYGHGAWRGPERQQDVFLLDYFPPAGPGLQPLRPFWRLPHRRLQRNRQGGGNGGAGRVATRTLGTSCTCPQIGQRRLS